VALDDRDRAFTWLDRAVREGSAWVTEISSPAWDEVRSDPRYIAVERKLGLPTSR
jgi:hypothetical protein